MRQTTRVTREHLPARLQMVDAEGAPTGRYLFGQQFGLVFQPLKGEALVLSEVGARLMFGVGEVDGSRALNRTTLGAALQRAGVI